MACSHNAGSTQDDLIKAIYLKGTWRTKESSPPSASELTMHRSMSSQRSRLQRSRSIQPTRSTTRSQSRWSTSSSITANSLGSDIHRRTLPLYRTTAHPPSVSSWPRTPRICSFRFAASVKPITTRSSLPSTSSPNALLPTSTLSPQDPRTSLPKEPYYSTSPLTKPSRNISTFRDLRSLLIFVLYLFIIQIILIFASVRRYTWLERNGWTARRSRKLSLKDPEKISRKFT